MRGSPPRSVLLATAVVLSLIGGAIAKSQGPETGAVPFRSLGSFTSLYVPTDTGDAGTLRREFIKWLTPAANTYPAAPPFGWKLVSSLPPDAGADVLVASLRRQPSVKAGVVVEFSDVNGRPIAVFEGKPLLFGWTSSSSLLNVVRGLQNLAFQTGSADRLIGSFTTLRLGTASGDADALKDRIAERLRKSGQWAVVNEQTGPDAVNAADVLDCSIKAQESIPPGVWLQCSDARGRQIVRLLGSNCRSCYGPLEFAPAGDMKRSADAVVKTLLEHHADVQRIYAPQLTGSSAYRVRGQDSGSQTVTAPAATLSPERVRP